MEVRLLVFTGLAAFRLGTDVFKYLYAGNILPGAIYHDTHIFAQADELDRRYGAPTEVWQLSVPVSGSDLVRIEHELQQSITAGNALGNQYSFSTTHPMPSDRDNCGT